MDPGAGLSDTLSSGSVFKGPGKRNIQKLVNFLLKN